MVSVWRETRDRKEKRRRSKRRRKEKEKEKQEKEKQEKEKREEKREGGVQQAKEEKFGLRFRAFLCGGWRMKFA